MSSAKYIRVFGYPIAFFSALGNVAGTGALGFFIIGSIGPQPIRVAPQIGLLVLKFAIPFTRKATFAGDDFAGDEGTVYEPRHLPIPTPFLAMTVDLGLGGVTVGFGLKTA